MCGVAWKVTVGSKASVNLLHEFCFKYLRGKLDFLVREIRECGCMIMERDTMHECVRLLAVPSSSLQQPFVCTAMIDGKPHGTGEGPSKKAAKQVAGERSIIL